MTTTDHRRSPSTASAARRAGAIGGGIAWLGLGVAQWSALLLLLPGLVGSFSFTVVGTEAVAELPPMGPVAWFSTPWGVVLVAGTILGLLVWLAGLQASRRILVAAGAGRPWRTTWLGFALSAATGGILAAVGCAAILAAFGGAGAILALPGFAETPRTSESGLPTGMFAPAQLLAEIAPVVALATFAPLVIPVALSALAWWLAARTLPAPYPLPQAR